ncbi:MAG: stage V sporulation protein AE [Defluviitaleaceae bacterium]|nr:stage V sporulation protein AE [Defluviitaleaceae bacterium]
MEYLKAFLVGGLICVVGQLLIDKTKITAGRVLVIFVVVGCILGGIGIYGRLVDFAGAGALVPLPGFGYLLTKGVGEEIARSGVAGIISGGIKATATGITAAVLFGLAASVFFNPKAKL